ncbi:MAG: hypothetical protein AAFQ80_18335 [Cyanobacteria bacterium J06621_8]
MTVSKPIKKQNSLQKIIQTWKDQIICFPPQGSGYGAYFVDTRNGELVNYIRASCDELRHLGSNYNSLLGKIKEQYYGYLKEAVLNSIKYEATRRVVKKQHEWIQSSYSNLIQQQELNVKRQSTEINHLKQIIEEQKQEVAQIKQECRGNLAAIQAEILLQQKEREIAHKNDEIARLNQQLEDCDREINSLKSELSIGLQELKLKYKGLITQFIANYSEQQQESRNYKSLQACQNILMKLQSKVNSPQSANKFPPAENMELHNKVKFLRVS